MTDTKTTCKPIMARVKRIDPALHDRGWTKNLIRREETAGADEIIDVKQRKCARCRVDYLLRVAVNEKTISLLKELGLDNYTQKSAS